MHISALGQLILALRCTLSLPCPVMTGSPLFSTVPSSSTSSSRSSPPSVVEAQGKNLTGIFGNVKATRELYFCSLRCTTFALSLLFLQVPSPPLSPALLPLSLQGRAVWSEPPANVCACQPTLPPDGRVPVDLVRFLWVLIWMSLVPVSVGVLHCAGSRCAGMKAPRSRLLIVLCLLSLVQHTSGAKRKRVNSGWVISG